jgi:GT2 family glycosyltransferase
MSYAGGTTMDDGSVPRVSVIIANLNGEKLLPGCLEGLKQSTFQDFEVVLVDNGSDDGSIEVARSIIPDIHVVSLASNQGFAGAVQRGFEVAKGEYIALLNNDAVPEPGWISGMVAVMGSDSAVGMVACRILNKDGDAIDSLGLGAARNGMAVLLGHGKPADWALPTGEPFGPSGAAGMYRREMLDQFGGFPERFFCYYEDMWVAWQGRLRGWRCVLADDAVVRHLGRGTPLTGFRNRDYWITVNKWRTIFSCWQPRLLWRFGWSIIGWEILIKLGAILSGQFVRAVAARVKAFWEMGYWMRIRKAAYSDSVVSARECRGWLMGSPSIKEVAGRRLR